MVLMRPRTDANEETLVDAVILEFLTTLDAFNKQKITAYLLFVIIISPLIRVKSRAHFFLPPLYKVRLPVGVLDSISSRKSREMTIYEFKKKH